MNVSREFLQINQEAGQAIWGIASILEKDAMAVDAGAGRIIDGESWVPVRDLKEVINHIVGGAK